MKQRGSPSLSLVSVGTLGCVATAVVVLVSVLALLGWMLNVEWLTSLAPQLTAMRVVTAICFLLSAVAVVCLRAGVPTGWKGVLTRAVGIAVIAVGLPSVACHLVELKTGQVCLLGHRPILSLFLDQDVTRMAVITSLLFTVFGCVLLLLSSRRQLAANLGHLVLLPAAVLSYMVLVGYIFNVQAFYAWTHLGAALNTGIAFSALCVAAFCTRPDTWLMSAFTRDLAGATMARRLLPALLVLPLLIGHLRLYGERSGLFASDVGVALVAVAYTVCFVGLVWFSAKSVNRSDEVRRHGQEALARERGNLQTIFDVVNVGMLLIDERGVVQRVNNTIARWIGKDGSACLGSQPGDLVGCIHAVADPAGCGRTPHCGACPIRQTFESVFRTGQSVHGAEAQACLSVQGKEVRLWLEVSADPVVLDGRRRVILSLNDITQRKQAEEALRRTAEDLARSNQDLEQFAYVSSHDLQEPLRMVTGFMQLLEQKYRGKLGADGDKYIHYAVDGAKRMQHLILDLLVYSRVGSKGGQPKPTDSGEALRQAQADLSVSIQESKAQITSGRLPMVRANASQLVQVFQNLIGNAIKFRSPGQPVVHVDACPDGDRWLLSVKDNGIGIDPEFHERVFVIFQRLHTKEKYAGTGIGLAICKKIIERHGGRMWVESHEGQGATFYFTLPAV